jgi:hypothetical protein
MSSNDDASGIRRAPSDQDMRSPMLREALDELATDESGLGFIYAALDLLATSFQLRDVVIVLEGEAVGLQIMRLGRRDVSVDLAVRLGATPGVYCTPDVVPLDDLDLVRLACQDALSYHSSPPVSPDYRTIISLALAIVDVVTFVLTVANVHGAGRFIFGLIFGLAIPGWSVIGLIKLKNAALEVGLTIATSLSLTMIVAQIMITVSLWHPVALEELVAVVCLPSLLWQSKLLVSRLARFR